MEWVVLIAANLIIGTVVGRILFVKRLGTSARFQMGKEENEFGYGKHDALVTTFDMDSAINYGLWSLVVWPITLAAFLVQAPTKRERKAKAEKQYQDMLELVSGHQQNRTAQSSQSRNHSD